jgi:hypothetical protein
MKQANTTKPGHPNKKRYVNNTIKNQPQKSKKNQKSKPPKRRRGKR